MAPAKKTKVSAGRKVKDKWKAKEWYKIHAPRMFNEAEIGETPSADPEFVLGRTVEVTVQDLTGDFSKMHIKLKFKVVSVDGYRLALRRETVEGYGDDCSFIVPGTALNDLERLCADSDEKVVMSVGGKHISFSVGNTVILSRRLEGEFLNGTPGKITGIRSWIKAMLSAALRVSTVNTGFPASIR